MLHAHPTATTGAHTINTVTYGAKSFSSTGVRVRSRASRASGVRCLPALYLSLASRKAFSLHSQRQWQSTHAPRTPNCHHRSSHNQHSDLRRKELVLHWSESQALSFAGVWGEMFASLELEPRISLGLVARLVGCLFVCSRRTCPFLDFARYVRDELNPYINAFFGKWVLTLKELTEVTPLSLPSFLVCTGRSFAQLVMDDQVLSSSLMIRS